jgi:ABC-2 type transport system ATP-binding protein
MMWAAEVVHVSKRYGRRLAVDDVTLSVDAGEILGLIGPNGAGKTTLLRVMAGLLRPTGGEIHINVADELDELDGLRYFGGERTLPPNASARRWGRLWSGSKRSGPLETRGTSLPNMRFGVLSRGTRQRIGLESVLGSGCPKLFLLDEPWEGLDPDATRWLSDTLKNKRDSGAGVIVSSHRVHDLAAVCGRCVFLVSGRLAPSTVTCDAKATAASRAAELFDAFDQVRAGRHELRGNGTHGKPF